MGMRVLGVKLRNKFKDKKKRSDDLIISKVGKYDVTLNGQARKLYESWDKATQKDFVDKLDVKMKEKLKAEEPDADV